MKLDVPYYSQYLDVTDPYWMPRACGMACAKMILDYYKKDTPELLDMVKQGNDAGGYHKENGWSHDYILELLKSHDLNSYRKEQMESVSEIHEALRVGSPVIVSVVKHILEQTKFHQVVLVGFTEDEQGNPKTVLYHDPENTSREYGSFREVDIEVFFASWRKMAIFVATK